MKSIQTQFKASYKKLVVCMFLCLPLYAFSDSSLVSDLVFITDEEQGGVNEIIGPLTVQSQNTSGSMEKVSETNDMEFQTTSTTGEFVNANGGAVSMTMSKNTASRTFYYRDSTPGNHIITVSIKGRESGKEFIATQAIVIGNASTVSNTSNSSNVSSSRTNTSAHTGQQDAISLKTNSSFKVDAGRARVVSIHTPITFKAFTDAKEDKKNRLSFDWSFGDGYAGEGGEIDHVYLFPGDYVVVLNASKKDDGATSRVDVRVVDPRLSGKIGNGFVEVINNSDEELNIGGFILSVNSGKFIVSKDTIIRRRGSIKIPVNNASTGTEFSIFFPTGVKAFESVREDSSVDEAVLRTKTLEQIVSLKRELAAALTEEDSAYMPPETEEEIDDTARLQNKNDINQTQKALLIESMKEEEKKGIVEFLKGIFGF